jgi:hypothetical protein
MPLQQTGATVPSGPTAPTDFNVSRDLTRPQRFASAADFLKSLPPHDGRPRLSTAATIYLGAKESRYCHQPETADELLRDFLLFAVGRALDPGCPSGAFPIFEGPMGRLPMLNLWHPGATEPAKYKWENYSVDTWPELNIDVDPSRLASGRKEGWLIAWRDRKTYDCRQMNASSVLRDFLTRTNDWESNPRGVVYYSTAADLSTWEPGILGLDCVAVIDAKEPDLRLIRADSDQLWAEALLRYREGHRWRIYRGVTGGR